MRVLILGSGGREHAIAWKIKQSHLLTKLFIAPGNTGTAECGENTPLQINDFKSIGNFVKQNKIDIVIVGPEDPLVNGIADYFSADKSLKDVAFIGPHKNGAQLEGSKDFAKEFMSRHGIPTAKYRSFNSAHLEEAYDFLEKLKPPYVLKADGLAGGKGVIIAEDIISAKKELKEMLHNNKFGEAASKVVIEEFLDGIEMSIFVLTDGKNYKILPEAKDYKRIGEGDIGLNTGGMGAISPVPFADDKLLKNIEEKIIIPTVEGLAKDQLKYTGFVFIGLMIVNNNPFVIEYNVRMGDPETEVVIPRIQSDFLAHLKALSNGSILSEDIQITPHSAATVMLVSKGYPQAYEKGKEIKGINLLKNCLPFHAGTIKRGDTLLTNGGRVMAITALGDSLKAALALSFDNVQRILFDGKNYRKDIGFDVIEDEKRS